MKYQHVNKHNIVDIVRTPNTNVFQYYIDKRENTLNIPNILICYLPNTSQGSIEWIYLMFIIILNDISELHSFSEIHVEKSELTS